MKSASFVAAACLVTAIVLVPMVSAGTQEKGAETITIDAGKRGAVVFPHRRHQQVLTDCRVCHFLFPQEKGAIARLQTEGRLKKMKVMNTLCTKCHRKRKAAGEKTGPTTCNTCHNR